MRDDFGDMVSLFQIWEKLDCLVLVGMRTYLRLKEEMRLLYDGQKVYVQFKKTYRSSENHMKWQRDVKLVWLQISIQRRKRNFEQPTATMARIF
ncbi:hypothetical protein L484_011401 [Morus notabilis]|uniref:Uncharacterized protein n=1 Tax=Morus notabilis TaxID=981085 RepID=W9S0I9_9ROSA|nr:hypothetical protein L484_011401 [Morus notabilis]